MMTLANAIDHVGRNARDLLDAIDDMDDEERIAAMRKLLDSIVDLATLALDATDEERDFAEPVLLAAERLTAKARALLAH
jgi:hypothetical protein